MMIRPVLAAVLETLILVLSVAAADKFEIRTLSSRPDMVSGGNVLVQIEMPIRHSANRLTVTLNGRDVTGSFQRGDKRSVGLVEGLSLGANTLSAKVPGVKAAAIVTVINHPITGPIISGPHQAPFVCQTATFELPVTGGTLGPPLDADCSIATRVDYIYRSKDGDFKSLADPKTPPSDVVQITTTAGRSVNYIVRVETGTINRAIYQIAILHDPAKDPSPDPWHAPAGWNGRLIYEFGGGCRAGYHQGTGYINAPPPYGKIRLVNVVNDGWLSRGYAATSSTLNVWNDDCNDVISPETLMMVKEHFIKQFGVPVHTIGTGASGGAMQVHLITQNYPGLLDGIIPTATHPDIISYLATNTADVALLNHAFQTAKVPWSLAQKTAVSGFANWERIAVSWLGFSQDALVPTKSSCDAAVPAPAIYEPVSNPRGIRCDLYDNMINIFGKDPKTGFARRPLDNVGVQYGLAAFHSGKISAEQFLDLNERIGGYDPDGKIVSQRTVADPEALRIAYRAGHVQTGSGGLANAPIINVHVYAESTDHHAFADAFMTRARLAAANGDSNNQVIVIYPASVGPITTLTPEIVLRMDQWLDNIANDPAPASHAKTVRNKPAGLVDACYTAGGEKIAEPARYDGTGRCAQLYPPHGNPRIAAGGNIASDTLKCALKPVEPKDYGQPLAPEQLRRLKTIFPQGVCDYTRPGAEQRSIQGTWFSYPLPRM